MNNKQLILFDGVCSFCNAAVNFIIERDTQECFVFAPIQSRLGQSVMSKYGLLDTPDTFVLIANGSSFVMSDAAIKVVKQLGGLWPAMAIFSIIPKGLRDFFYRLFGRFRYRLFGKLDSCLTPTPDLQLRFVGNSDASKW